MRIIGLAASAALALAAAACDNTDQNTVSTDANLIEGDDAANAALGGEVNLPAGENMASEPSSNADANIDSQVNAAADTVGNADGY